MKFEFSLSWSGFYLLAGWWIVPALASVLLLLRRVVRLLCVLPRQILLLERCSGGLNVVPRVDLLLSVGRHFLV